MTIVDIAKNLNLSIATISRAINGTGKIKPETKERVLEYIKEVGYTPSAIARNLSTRKTKSVAILVPNIVNSFFSNLVNEICKKFNEKKYDVILYNTNESRELEREAIRNIAAQRVNFVVAIMVKSNYSNNPLKRLQTLGVKCLLLDRDIEKYEFRGVFLHNYSASYNIVKELIREGHKNIGIIAGEKEITSSNERLKGYIDALTDANIPIKNENIYIGKFDIKTGEEGLKYFKDREISAIYAVNNQILLGILKQSKEIKKKLRVACFEKIEVLEFLGVDILGYEIPVKEISEAVFEEFENEKIEKKYIELILKKEV